MQFKPGDLVLVVKMSSAGDQSLIGKSGEILHVCTCPTGFILCALTGKLFYRVQFRPHAECLREDCLRKISPPGDLNEVEQETNKAVPA